MTAAEWLRLNDAVELIRSVRKIGDGAAIKLLISACADGVRTQQQPCWGDLPWTIPTAVWRDAHLDLDTGELYPAGTDPHNPPTEEGGYGHGGNGIIEVNAVDLRECLSAPPTILSVIAPAKERVQPKRERAMRAIAVLYPNGVPPQSSLPNKVLCNSVREHLKDHSEPSQISDDSILRAAGRKGAGQK
jgi:hypothetical protein